MLSFSHFIIQYTRASYRWLSQIVWKNLLPSHINWFNRPSPIYVACISGVNNFSAVNSAFNMIINPNQDSDSDNSASPSCSNQTLLVPLIILKNFEKSPVGSRSSTSELFNMILFLNIPMEPALGLSKAQSSRLGFQKIVVSFGLKVCVCVVFTLRFPSANPIW